MFRFEQAQERAREIEPSEKLKEAIRHWSDILNAEFRSYCAEPDRAGALLEGSCRIDMRAFMTKRGGPYPKEEREGKRGVQDDEMLAHTHEIVWSGAREDRTKKRYGTDDEEEIVRRWQADEEKHDGALAESAVLCVLNKVLGERFVAVRASKYDDYENGVDTLILDRESGGVVCAFDEVVGAEDGDRYAHKIERARDRLAARGGMRVKYGLAFSKMNGEGARLDRRSLPNIPGFCISLSREDLHRLIRTADFNRGAAVSEIERSVFRGVVRALHLQEDTMKSKLGPEQRSQVDELIRYAEARSE